MAAWLPPALAGLFLVNIAEQVERPVLFAEPRNVTGPEGPRLLRAADDAVPLPIEARA